MIISLILANRADYCLKANNYDGYYDNGITSKIKIYYQILTGKSTMIFKLVNI